MKTKIFTLLILLISNCIFRVNSQTASISSVNSNNQMASNIKAFESRYVDGKVFLHITINGNIVTKFLAVERSLDATNYEVIGYVKIYGTPVLADLAYYFTDESPVKTDLYYRLTDYTLNNEPVYSATITVIPIENINIIPEKINNVPASPAETYFIVGDTK